MYDNPYPDFKVAVEAADLFLSPVVFSNVFDGLFSFKDGTNEQV